MKITIINTGGTFNKRYNPINGQLEVPLDNLALKMIIKDCPNIEFEIKNPISKDSLCIDDNDRKLIVKSVIDTKNDKIIIIHGTDTMAQTSEFLSKQISNKKIVFTGSMIPMSIKVSEATMNFSQAIGFLNANIENGIYISMHGIVSTFKNLIKNKEKGQFLLNSRN